MDALPGATDTWNFWFNVSQTIGVPGCLIFAVRWFNNRDQKRDAERATERQETYSLLFRTIEEARTDAKECREASERKEKEFREFIAKEREAHRLQIDGMITRHEANIKRLEDKVYESLATQRAMEIELRKEQENMRKEQEKIKE